MSNKSSAQHASSSFLDLGKQTNSRPGTRVQVRDVGPACFSECRIALLKEIGPGSSVAMLGLGLKSSGGGISADVVSGKS